MVVAAHGRELHAVLRRATRRLVAGDPSLAAARSDRASHSDARVTTTRDRIAWQGVEKMYMKTAVCSRAVRCCLLLSLAGGMGCGPVPDGQGSETDGTVVGSIEAIT